MIYKNNFENNALPYFVETVEPIKIIGKIARKPVVVSILETKNDWLLIDIRVWKSEKSPTHIGICITGVEADLLQECITEYRNRREEKLKTKYPESVFANLGYIPFSDE